MLRVINVQRAGADHKPRFCETATAQAILGTLAYCQEHGEMGLIVGEPGIGKTTAAEHFVEADSYLRWYAKVMPASQSVQGFLRRLVDTLGGIAERHVGTLDCYDIVLEEVSRRRGASLLVIDEAHLLDAAAVEQVRALYDELQFGVVFIGHRELAFRWQHKPGNKRNAWAQLTSRIGPWLDLTEVLPEDVDAICESRGVTGRRERTLLAKHAKGPGGLRTVVKVINVAATIAGGDQIEMAHIEQALAIRGQRG